MKAPDDGFVGRWSRRKRAAEQSDVAPPAPVELPEPAPEPGPVALTEEQLDALPKVEDLVEGSDIKAFLQAGVPRALRSAALRKLWMLTPAIRDYKNPAVDYAWDYNTPGGVPGDGCAPSPERAAQMMRELFAPRTPVEPQAAALSEAEETPAEDPDTPDEVGTDQPPIATAPTTDDAHPARQAMQAPPGPRHGGALPS